VITKDPIKPQSRRTTRILVEYIQCVYRLIFDKVMDVYKLGAYSFTDHPVRGVYLTFKE